VCFLGYSVEHKGNHYWDSVARRTQTSCDVVFDESRPFYLRPTTDASSVSLVDLLSFLLFLMLLLLFCLFLVRLYCPLYLPLSLL
jgi:hypothetical protein